MAAPRFRPGAAPEHEIVALAKLPRACLHVVIKHKGTRFSLLNAHLKSKLLTYPGGRFGTEDERERALVAHSRSRDERRKPWRSAIA